MVRQIYPNCDLIAFISPTTDLAREGLNAPSTVVDPGFHGTLNWTITNNGIEERRFVYKERIFRITILKLEDGEEIPQDPYTGHYSGKTGYVPSERLGAPAGIKPHNWVKATKEGGPEDTLEQLLQSGFPWRPLARMLKEIGEDYQTVTAEYDQIADTLDKMEQEMAEISTTLDRRVRTVIKDEAANMQARWVGGTVASLVALAALVVAISGSDSASAFVEGNALTIGLMLFFIAAATAVILMRKK